MSKKKKLRKRFTREERRKWYEKALKNLKKGWKQGSLGFDIVSPTFNDLWSEKDDPYMISDHGEYCLIGGFAKAYCEIFDPPLDDLCDEDLIEFFEPLLRKDFESCLKQTLPERRIEHSNPLLQFNDDDCTKKAHVLKVVRCMANHYEDA